MKSVKVISSKQSACLYTDVQCTEYQLEVKNGKDDLTLTDFMMVVLGLLQES